MTASLSPSGATRAALDPHPYRSWHKRGRGAPTLRVRVLAVAVRPVVRVLRQPACPMPASVPPTDRS